jgi:hypothetical protein
VLDVNGKPVGLTGILWLIDPDPAFESLNQTGYPFQEIRFGFEPVLEPGLAENRHLGFLDITGETVILSQFIPELDASPDKGMDDVIQQGIESFFEFVGICMYHEVLERPGCVENKQNIVIPIFLQLELFQPVDFPEAFIYIEILFQSR